MGQKDVKEKVYYSLFETIIDQLKYIIQIKQTGHRSVNNFLANKMAYSLKKNTSAKLSTVL